MEDINFNKFLEKLSSSKNVPGGGSCAALVAAMASGLVSMVLEITNNKNLFSTFLYSDIHCKLQALRKEFMHLYKKDIKVYNEYRKKQNTEENEDLLKKTIEVPKTICQKLVSLVSMMKKLSEYTKGDIVNDLIASMSLIEASYNINILNIKYNSKFLLSSKEKECIEDDIKEFDAKLSSDFKYIKDKFKNLI